LPVGLYCPKTDLLYRRRICDISVGGVYVCGSPCGRTGMEFDVIVNPVNQVMGQARRFTAEVVRNSATGFALKFNYLGETERRLLEDVIWPEWDGEDMYEGLLIIAARENIVDLAGWLHLTSIVCNQYRRLCCKPHSPKALR